MSQISLGRKNVDDDLEPITPTNPVESRTVAELPMQNVNTVIRVCFSAYPSFIALPPEQLQLDPFPHIVTLGAKRRVT